MTRVGAHEGTISLTLEVPLAIAGVWAITAAYMAFIGQAAAYKVVAGQFAWPRGDHAKCWLALVRGQPGQGVDQVLRAHAPSAAIIYASIGLLEATTLAAAAFLFRLWWMGFGPGSTYGLARRRQVAQVLGPKALWERRRTIRPDLHARPTKR